MIRYFCSVCNCELPEDYSHCPDHPAGPIDGIETGYTGDPADAPWHSSTYGVLPSRARFAYHYGLQCQDREYTITHGSCGRDDRPDGSYTEDELWAYCVRAVEQFNETGEGLDDEDSPIQWVSSILYTLHFEWI